MAGETVERVIAPARRLDPDSETALPRRRFLMKP